MIYPITGGFPNSSAPFTDPKTGRLTREGTYLLQLLFNRTGSVGGDFLTGQLGLSGPPGPALVLDVPDVDDQLFMPPRTFGGGWFDEKGSGGTYGFAAGVDFTSGTTTALTLSQPYGWQANLIVTFDGAWQGADQFSLVGTALTFTSAIPVGVEKVYVKGFLMPQ